MKRTLAALVLLASARAGSAQPTPGGKIVETKDGIVFERNTPAPRPTRDRTDASADAGGGLVTLAPPHNSGPTGPSVVNAAYRTVRGSLVRLDKGEAITVLDGRTGKERRIPLAKGAFVHEGIKPGDAVTVRIPFEEGSDARTADRVEPQKTPAALDPKSKFTQAQAPATR